jgi:hypothetical protein
MQQLGAVQAALAHHPVHNLLVERRNVQVFEHAALRRHPLLVLAPEFLGRVERERVLVVARQMRVPRCGAAA